MQSKWNLCVCEWGCSHCTQATSKGLRSNLRSLVLCGLGLKFPDGSPVRTRVDGDDGRVAADGLLPGDDGDGEGGAGRVHGLVHLHRARGPGLAARLHVLPVRARAVRHRVRELATQNKPYRAGM